MKKIISKILFDKWPLKLLAFLMAVLLWFYLAGSEINEFSYNVPVTFSNLPIENIIINGSKYNIIKVTIKGTNITAMNRNINEFKIIKDLSNFTPGLHDVRIYHQDIIYPAGTELVSYDPRVISIEIDKKQIKRVNFSTPVIKGTPVENYEISGINLSDDYTQIEGPESVLKNIKSLQLEHIDITGISESISKEVNILAPDNISIVGVEKVTVSIEIKKK